MKDFYREHEDYNPFWTHEEYMKNKREKVLTQELHSFKETKEGQECAEQGNLIK